MAANVYNIQFTHFQIVDYESKQKIFEVGVNCPPRSLATVDLSRPLDENMYRKIRYEFSEDVLRLPTIKTTLEFAVGKKEVPNFRMIERHYFRDELVKSFDFTFGFCIPASHNTWDAIYALPPLEDDLINDMIANPFATTSDSFYFVDDELIMHNKAEYKYIEEDRAQAKRSYYDDEYQAKISDRDDDAKDDAKDSYQEKWSKEEDYGDN